MPVLARQPSKSLDNARRGDCAEATSAARRPPARRQRHSCGRRLQRPVRLGSYKDGAGRRREVVTLGGCGGSLLVVDRDATTLRDRRLVAHLGCDEPAGNAALVARSYLCRRDDRRCRRLTPRDLLTVPPGEIPVEQGRQQSELSPFTPVQAQGFVYRLAAVRHDVSAPELRWCLRHQGEAPGSWQPVGLRQTIAVLQSYEPVRGITAAALAGHHPGISRRRLRNEYRRLCTSPVVLNRALREAVLCELEAGRLSMSEIALRCGVVKRDRQGKQSGETSWLARRVGLMPESGARHVTPWIHSDVLALIAREGLRVSPREVEVP